MNSARAENTPMNPAHLPFHGIMSDVPFAVWANLLILLVVLAGPFLSHRVERNLEGFLLVMGVLSALASGVLNVHLLGEGLRHPIPITIAVFLSGAAFTWGRRRLDQGIRWMLARSGPGVLAAVATAVLGLASFAIGLGAAPPPVGEPLSTIATAKLDQDFWFLFRLLGVWVVPGVLALGVVAWAHRVTVAPTDEVTPVTGPESYRDVFTRAARVYLFVMALTLLGEGFKPIIDRYVISLGAPVLYWINLVSAILDNATLTAAEISPRMTDAQV